MADLRFQGYVRLDRQHGLEVWVATVYRHAPASVPVLVAQTTMFSEAYARHWACRTVSALAQLAKG